MVQWVCQSYQCGVFCGQVWHMLGKTDVYWSRVHRDRSIEWGSSHGWTPCKVFAEFQELAFQKVFNPFIETDKIIIQKLEPCIYIESICELTKKYVYTLKNVANPIKANCNKNISLESVTYWIG